MNIEELAGKLYTAYCKSVGGKAFNGDPLPDWDTFKADPKKRLQYKAWIDVALASPRPPAEEPLKCGVIDDRLVISIGINTLADCSASSFESDEDPKFKVISNEGFAKDVASKLQSENEVGATCLTDALDKAIRSAVESGSEHVQYED